ncbi:unnamed protein product [Symbiodinium sp. CCMP2592]|nr:unnamed protein product [Symbiodinium sp. CCMP2592]
MQDVETVLSNKYPINTFMVKAAPGESFAKQTLEGLQGMAGMVAFCSSQYGEKTGVGYETFEELKYAHEHQIPVIPVRLCHAYPPQPQKIGEEAPCCCHTPRPERDDWGCAQNELVLNKSLVYIDGLTAEGKYIPSTDLADKIHASLSNNGFIREVSSSFEGDACQLCTPCTIS